MAKIFLVEQNYFRYVALSSNFILFHWGKYFDGWMGRLIKWTTLYYVDKRRNSEKVHIMLIRPPNGEKHFSKTWNVMALVYGWSSNVSRLHSHYKEIVYTTKSPGVSGTHLIEFGKLKGWVSLKATQWFWTQDPWFGNPALTARQLWDH